MKLRALICFSALLLAVALRAQSTPPPLLPPVGTLAPVAPAAAPVLPPGEALGKSADPEAPTHYGMRYADFVQVNEAMMQTALEDPAIAEISKRVEALIAQRDAMIAEATIRKNPAVAEKIKTMQRNVTELKKKKAEQDEKVRGLKKGKSAEALPPKN